MFGAPSFTLLVLAVFIVGLTVYFVQQNSDEYAWLYVLILLMGIMLWAKNTTDGTSFVQELVLISPWGGGGAGTTKPPTRAPGTTTGPF